MIHIDSSINKLTQNIQAELSENNQGIEVDLSMGIIYALSPIANITLMSNGNYLITITDKLGTTTAEIPNFTDAEIDRAIENYLNTHSVIANLIEEHNLSEQAHQDIRNLIQQAINRIPTRLSQLINDQHFIKNIKDLIISYNSYLEFPNIPTQEERDMIFLDESTGDMYIFGMNDSLSYTAIGISNNDVINGGDSSLT